MHVSKFIAIFCVVSLAGCVQILKSSSGISNHSDVVLDYRLPKALLPVKLQKATGPDPAANTVYAVEIGAPRYIGDTEHSYILDYKASPLASDDFIVKVHSRERVLTSVKVKTDDNTDEIVVKIAETAAIFEDSKAVTAAETLLEIEIDPANQKDIEYAREALHKVSNGAVSYFEIPNQSLSAGLVGSTCSGICYRLPLKYSVRFGFDNGRVFTRNISLPNGGPIVSLNLNRAAFVEKVHEISFTDGSPAEMKLKKPSEGLEFVALPIEIVKAILQAPAEILQLKINQNDKEKELANSKNEKLKAQAELAKTLANNRGGVLVESSQAESNLVFMFGANGPWGSIPLTSSGELEPGPGVEGSPGTGPNGSTDASSRTRRSGGEGNSITKTESGRVAPLGQIRKKR